MAMVYQQTTNASASQLLQQGWTRPQFPTLVSERGETLEGLIAGYGLSALYSYHSLKK